ncbi:hypothetical protein M3Y99_00852300 [Aphelenchoides fujianensis]|nr:hypothetical protein M3Y99_00852300 [Aphelenchoides fujianensis]
MQLSSSKILVFVAFAVCLAEVSAFYESNRMFLMDRNWWLRRRNQWAREPPVVVERRSAGDVVDLAPVDFELDGEPLERAMEKRSNTARFFPYVQLRHIAVQGRSIPTRVFQQV